MKKQFDFDNLKLSDYEYVQDIYIDEVTCDKPQIIIKNSKYGIIK